MSDDTCQHHLIWGHTNVRRTHVLSCDCVDKSHFSAAFRVAICSAALSSIPKKSDFFGTKMAPIGDLVNELLNAHRGLHVGFKSSCLASENPIATDSGASALVATENMRKFESPETQGLSHESKEFSWERPLPENHQMLWCDTDTVPPRAAPASISSPGHDGWVIPTPSVGLYFDNFVISFERMREVVTVSCLLSPRPSLGWWTYRTCSGT